MTGTALTDDQRDVVTILAFAAREFDRVRDLLVKDDEPGTEQVAGRVVEDDDARPEHKNLARTLLGAVGTVAGGAGRLVVGSTHPAARSWARAGVDDRIDWWVERFGTAAAALAAVPGLGGKVGKLIGIDDVVGAAAQILVVNAVARELGVSDVGQRVVVAARIVLGHDLDPAAVATALDAPEAQPEADAPGESAEERRGPLAWAGRTAQLVWRVGRRIRTLRSNLDERRQGGLLSRAVSNLPGVGALGLFVSERSGISTAAKDARAAFGG